MCEHWERGSETACWCKIERMTVKAPKRLTRKLELLEETMHCK